MAKAKTAGEQINGTAESFTKHGAEAFKDGFEKAVKGYDQFFSFGKDTVEAYLVAANAAGKGAQAFHSELFGFSKHAIEESIATAKAVAGSKSVKDAVEIQSDFAKTQFDAYVSQVAKLGEIFVSTAKETFEPIQGRVQALADVVQHNRAA
jgi:phasin family protein